MFSQLAGVLLKKRLASSPTVSESIDEAASQYLGKQAKVETAIDGIFANDLRELAQADRERVAAYIAAKVPGLARSQKAKGKMPGDFIICDDYRKGTGTVAAVTMGVVLTAALGFGGFGLWMAMQDRTPEEPPAAVDADTQYLLELVPSDE